MWHSNIISWWCDQLSLCICPYCSCQWSICWSWRGSLTSSVISCKWLTFAETNTFSASTFTSYIWLWSSLKWAAYTALYVADTALTADPCNILINEFMDYLTLAKTNQSLSKVKFIIILLGKIYITLYNTCTSSRLC
jgi:hypothetical protein